MAPRCVKCAGPHHTKDCDKGDGRIDSVKCCNCNGDHPASYRGCPKFPENKRKFQSNRTSPNFSYAAAASNNNSKNQQTPSPNIKPNEFFQLTNCLNEIAHELQAPNFSTLLIKFQNVLNRIKQTTNPLEKFQIFCDAMNTGP